MKVENFKLLSRSEHPDMPAWFEKIADQWNRQMETLTRVAQGNATFRDNFLAEVRTLEMAQDTVVPIELQLLRQDPIGVLLLWSSYFDYPRMKARMSETAPMTVDVAVKWDTPPEAVPEVTLVFFG